MERCSPAQSNDQSISLSSQSPLAFPVGRPHCINSPAASGSVINGGQPEGHVGTGAGKGHKLGVELQTGNGTSVFAIQYSHFYTTLSIPDVDFAVF